MKLVWNCLASFWLLMVIAVAATAMSREALAQQRGLQQSELEEERDQSAPTDVESEAAKLQKATPEELQAKLQELRKVRIAALRKATEAKQREVEAGITGATNTALLDAYTKVAEAELEDNDDSVDRIRALKEVVKATIRIENLVRAKHEAFLVGYGEKTMQQATAARLKAQTRLAKEILAQKAGSTSRKKLGQQSTPLRPGLEEEREQPAPTDVESETAVLESATLEELQKKIQELRKVRIAALRKVAEVVEQEVNVDVAGATVASLLIAQAAVVEMELEDNDDPVDRMRALNVLVNATIQVESVVGAGYEASLRGYGVDTMQQATAARLKAQTRLAKEVLAQKVAATSGETLGQNRSPQRPGLEGEREQSAPIDAESEFAAFQKATPAELQKKLQDLRTARIAALRTAVDAVEQYFDAGLAEPTVTSLLDAHASVADAELEENDNSVDRIDSLKRLFRATSRVEREVRRRHEVGYPGFGTSTYQQAIAARMKAQTRLTKEILSQKEQAKSLTPQR